MHSFHPIYNIVVQIGFCSYLPLKKLNKTAVYCSLIILQYFTGLSGNARARGTIRAYLVGAGFGPNSVEWAQVVVRYIILAVNLPAIYWGHKMRNYRKEYQRMINRQRRRCWWNRNKENVCNFLFLLAGFAAFVFAWRLLCFVFPDWY